MYLLKLRDHVSHPHTGAGKVFVLYILTSIVLKVHDLTGILPLSNDGNIESST
jgi:hypothetical protein